MRILGSVHFVASSYPRLRMGAIGATILALTSHSAFAVISASSGYIYSTLEAGNTAQSCVAAAPNGTFVGVGPGFSANANSIVQVSESGTVRVVATGFSSISDCAYDAASDTLYVGDNADSGDIPAALTGDTVFAIPTASTATNLPAVGLELLPANSLPAVAGLALDADGDLLAAEANGIGTGVVSKITVAGPSLSTFATGFDFVSGVAIQPSNNNVLVAESLASFESEISRFTSAGAFVSTLAGPSFAFGSYDLAFTHDGLLLATGSGAIAAFDTVGTRTTFASGFSFPTGITTNSVTGRVEIIDSFSFTAADSQVHRFTPIAKLVPGGRAKRSECVHEFYGVELVAKNPGAVPREAICVDGAECDIDGTANGVCVFPVGFCFRASDPRFPECAANDIAEVEITSKPTSVAVDGLSGEIQSALPLTAPTCFFSDGYSVPVRTTNRGDKAGRGSIKVKSKSAAAKDNDTLKLVCQPAP